MVSTYGLAPVRGGAFLAYGEGGVFDERFRDANGWISPACSYPSMLQASWSARI